MLVNGDEAPRTGGCKKYTVTHAGRTAGKLLVYANVTLDWCQMLSPLAKLLVGNRICLTDPELILKKIKLGKISK